MKIVIELMGSNILILAHRNLTLTTWKKDKDWYNYLIKENKLDSQLDWDFKNKKKLINQRRILKISWQNFQN